MELADTQKTEVARIIACIKRSRVDLSNEKSTQMEMAEVFTIEQLPFVREVHLSKSNIIDFLIGDIGVEVKLRGANRQDIFRQLTRYAKSEQISCLILATNLSMGLPEQIEGKSVFYVNLAEGWM